MNKTATPEQVLEAILNVVHPQAREVIRDNLFGVIEAAAFVDELERLPRYVWEERDTIRNIHDLRHMVHAYKVQQQVYAAEVAAELEYISWGR